MIEAKISYDAVNPRIKRALEAEASDVLISLEEGVLINILRVVLGAGQVQRQPQHRLIVVAHQFLEGAAVAALRLADENRIVNAAFLPSHAAPHGVLLLTDNAIAGSVHSVALCSRVGPCTNRKCYR